MRRPYHRPYPKDWWLKHPHYLKFMIRELTAVFVGYFAFWTICLVLQAARGPEELSRFLQAMAAPGWLIWHAIGLVGVLFHTYTWFETAPKVLVLRIGEKKVPEAVVIGAQWAVLVVVSIVFLMLLRLAS